MGDHSVAAVLLNYCYPAVLLNELCFCLWGILKWFDLKQLIKEDFKSDH